MGKRKSHSKKDKENSIDEYNQPPSQSISQSIKPPARKKIREEDSDDEVIEITQSSLRLQPSKQQMLITPNRTINPSSSQSSSQTSEFGDTARKLNLLMTPNRANNQSNNQTMQTPGRNQKKFDPMLVFCRVRPLNEKEKQSVSQSSPQVGQSDECIKVVSGTMLTCNPPRGSRSTGTQDFNFSQVFDQSINQATLFNQSVKSLIFDAITGGFNFLFFAYGVTNSGKTFTMQGGEGENRGVIPRGLELIFDWTARENRKLLSQSLNQAISQAGNQSIHQPIHQQVIQYSVKVSYLEIYNEKVLDLLNLTQKATPRVLTLADDPLSEGVIVKNLTEIDCLANPAIDRSHNMDDIIDLPVDQSNDQTLEQAINQSITSAMNLLRQGAQHRKVSKTALNKNSSRSHSCFIIKVMQQSVHQTINQATNEVVSKVQNEQLWSKISIVDLAGSERQTRTHDTQSTNQDLQKEANAINNSLTTLGRCMQALRENSKIQQSNNNQSERQAAVPSTPNPFINQALQSVSQSSNPAMPSLPSLNQSLTPSVSQSMTQKAKKLPPFRDSSLTRLFKESFCGVGRTAMLCAVSTLLADYDESVLALRYAAEASNIKFVTQINQPITQTLTATLAEKITQSASKTLKKKLIESSPIKITETSTSQPIDQSMIDLLTERFNELQSINQSKYEDQIYSLKQCIADLTYELSEVESTNQSMNAELLTNQANQYEYEIEQAISRAISVKEAEMNKQTVKQQKQYEGKITDLSQSIEQLKNQRKILENQLTQLTHELNEVNAEKQHLNEKIYEQMNLIERARDQLLEQSQEHEQSINQLNEQIEQLTSQVTELSNEKESIKQSNEKLINQLNEEIASLNQSVEQLTEQSTSQCSDVDRLTAQITELESLNASLRTELQQSHDQAVEQANQAEADRDALLHSHHEELQQLEQSHTQAIQQAISDTVSEQQSLAQQQCDKLQHSITQLKQHSATQSTEIERLKGENHSLHRTHQSLQQEHESVSLALTEYQALQERFQSVVGISISDFIEQTLSKPAPQQSKSRTQSVDQTTTAESTAQSKRTRTKRASLIQSEDFIHSVDIAAATPVKPQPPAARKGKRLSIVTDQSQQNMKTAPASSLVHALNESRSLDLFASPKRFYTINQSTQPPSPSVRSITQSTRQQPLNPTPLMSPAVIKVLKGGKTKKTKSNTQTTTQSTQQSNKENCESEMNVFDIPAADEDQPLAQPTKKEKKEKKEKNEGLKSAKLKAALSKTNDQANNQSVNINEWDAAFGQQPKYGRSVAAQVAQPVAVVNQSQPTPVAKRTRQRTHS